MIPQRLELFDAQRTRLIADVGRCKRDRLVAEGGQFDHEFIIGYPDSDRSRVRIQLFGQRILAIEDQRHRSGKQLPQASFVDGHVRPLLKIGMLGDAHRQRLGRISALNAVDFV